MGRAHEARVLYSASGRNQAGGDDSIADRNWRLSPKAAREPETRSGNIWRQRRNSRLRPVGETKFCEKFILLMVELGGIELPAS